MQSQLTSLRLRFLSGTNNNTLPELTKRQSEHLAQCQDTGNAEMLAIDTIVQVRKKGT